MTSGQKYLFIIDDSPQDEKLLEYFAKFDFQIIHYASLDELNKLQTPPTALLINWSIFQEQLSVLDELYRRYTVPLIILAEQYHEETCVKVLEAGADDFIIKPIHPRELHARISAIARRVQRTLKEIEPDKDVLLFANWRLYPASRQVFDLEHQELALSAGEYELLFAFVRQPQRVLGRDFLLQITKNSDLTPFDRRIDVQISRLRQKIETDAKKPALIKTIRNGGYLFTARVLTIKEGAKEE